MRIFIYSFAAIVLLAACEGKKPVRETPVRDTIETVPPVTTDSVKAEPAEPEIEEPEPMINLNLLKDDNELLVKLDTLSLNSSFRKIKESFRGVKGIRPEGGSTALAEQGLTETKSVTKFMQYKADLEFNFKNDSLYSYYVYVHEEDPDKSDELYQGIHDHYAAKYGECMEEKIEEENHFFRSCRWDINNKALVITYNVNTGMIGWGYQELGSR